ncbi:hypothetical protein ACFWWA_27900 [Streptomyces goshikiensis]|uniref:hypothetical protein n=1 Tax=Streptomyces goshikiensis TaxID=1942 RepID=UPI003660C80D
MTERVLASWNEGPARRAILDYAHKATTPGAAFVEPADRIATFDNDGTLWVEQPMPRQFDSLFRTWEGEVKADPSLAARQPYKALVERDQEFFDGLATQDPEAVATLLEAFARSWAGTTPEEFDAQVREWTRTVRDPRFGVPYVELVYRPMVELFDLLRANGIWGRVSPSTSSPTPADCPPSRAVTPTSTSRCSRAPRSHCSSATTTTSASTPTPRAPRPRSPRRRPIPSRVAPYGFEVPTMNSDRCICQSDFMETAVLARKDLVEQHRIGLHPVDRLIVVDREV